MEKFIRVGLGDREGNPFTEDRAVLEVMGIPLASAPTNVLDEPGSYSRWEKEFEYKIVSLLAELMQERRMKPHGWLMATRLSPTPPNIAEETE